MKQFSFKAEPSYVAAPADVFPLLCPVREADYLEGWDYTMIHSESGLAEMGCVFSTPHHGDQNTIWTVSQYDRSNHLIEFIRVTPGQELVKIAIQLRGVDGDKTRARIEYTITPLTEERGSYLENDHEEHFQADLFYWEEALNYYLITGERLGR